MQNPLARDLDHVLAQTGGLWDELRGARLFLTGGTGFFGCWLLETLLWANDRLRLDASVVVLTRDADGLQKQGAASGASSGGDAARSGDVRTFDVRRWAVLARHSCGDRVARDARRARSAGDVRHDRRRHAAARWSSRAASGARRFLLTSSGAVYGRQPAGAHARPEDYAGGPDPANAGQVYARRQARGGDALCAAR